jgi:homoserine kinase type II
MTGKEETTIYEELAGDAAGRFGFRIRSAAPVRRGWRNKKWVLDTDRGRYLLKQFDSRRYGFDLNEPIRFGLRQQNRLHAAGLPCPRLMTDRYGEVLHVAANGERYNVMEYIEGALLAPGGTTQRQLHALGLATARMHNVLNDGSLGVRAHTEFVPPSRAERLAHWDRVEAQMREAGKTGLLGAVELHRETTALLEIEDFRLAEAGWAHRDLWLDNLLFTEQGVAAVLDFDRLRYDVPALDAARALLNACMAGGEWLRPLAEAFASGYRLERALTEETLDRAMRLLYWLESEWWIRADMDLAKGPPVRFVEEMHWLAEQLRAKAKK